MFGERRKHQRLSIKRMARIQAVIGGVEAMRDCTVTNISENGARLFVEDDDLPEWFYLVVVGDNAKQHECKVVWRLGGELGVEFVTAQADQSRMNSMNRLREDARKIFQGADPAS